MDMFPKLRERLVLHPLSRFPGPKLAAVTRWYEAYFDIVRNGQYTFKLANMHRKYGPVVRISPYELHVSDPTFFEKLYRQDGRWDKYAWTYNGFSAEDNLVNSTGPHEPHKARRLPFNHFFSKSRVAANQEIIDRSVAKLSALSAITRDISCAFIINKTYGALDKDDFNVAVTNMFQEGGRVWHITKHVPWFGPTMRSIPHALISKVADEGTNEFFQYTRESEEDTKNLLRLAAAPRVNEEMPRTIIHEILDSKLPPAEKALSRVMNDVATVTGAGFETTASVMRLICYHLSGDAKVEIKALEKLPYLTSIIMEGMRQSPAIGSRMACIAPDRDLFCGNLRIPAGTPVGMTTILMHTYETLYPDPLSFNPDRWMDPEARKKVDKTYAPFSKGTRICLGMHLAWAEMYLILAVLVQRFDFKFQDIEAKGFEMESDQFIISVKAGAGLKAHVTPVEA
ncbi:cytochrome P450 [Xylariaceae sp. FL0662B]|nr:cytochrome P450 [Xylariaceae sp. FL0662B]